MEGAARLKKLRLEKGLSLEEAQKKTKVHLNILKAIEGDSITNLNPVYLKGFLKIYCNFLGVDPKDFADYKEAQAPAAAAKMLVEEAGKEKPRKTNILESAGEKLDSLRPSKNFKTAVVLVLVVVLVFFGLSNLLKMISRHKARANLTRLTKTEAGKEQKTQKAETPAVKPKAAETEPKKSNSSGIKLGIKARENCWVDLKVDGKVVFRRVLEKGRFESWQAKEKMELSLGNAGAVELQLNDKIFSSLGKKGQALKNIVITKDGLNIPR